jgi:hypothetical protein
MELELVKFAFDLLKEIRDVFDKHKEAKDSLTAKGTLLELYGCATLIEGKSVELLKAKASDTTVESIAASLHDFSRNLGAFVHVLQRANVGAIEIWHPELARELAGTVGQDIELIGYFRGVADRFGLKPAELDKISERYWHWSQLMHSSDSMQYYLTRGGRILSFDERASKGPLGPLGPFGAPMIVNDGLWEALDSLSKRLPEFRRILAEVIRNTWEFKDLFTLPMKK